MLCGLLLSNHYGLGEKARELVWLCFPRVPTAGCPASHPVVDSLRRATNPYWSEEA